MKTLNIEFKQELISCIFHPMKLQRLADKYNIDLIDLVNNY
jgi:hypothetical protein